MEGSSHTKAEPEYEVMRSWMSLQGVALLWGFLGPETALGVSRRDIQKKGLFAGWLASGGQDDEELATLEDRLED